MKVMIKFSDLRKLQDEADWFKEMHDDSNRKLDIAIKNEKQFQETIKNKDTEILKLQCKLDEIKDAAEEIKLLTEENNVLIEENNKLKNFAERRQPKFWFGDKVRVLKDGGTFEINQVSFTGNSYHYSRIGDIALISETSLELVTDENISK